MTLSLHSHSDVRACTTAPIRLARNTTVERGFVAIMRGGFDHMRRNQRAAVGGGNIECIHQVRVAIRRLNATLTLFRDVIASPTLRGIKADLKWLSGRLGVARDWDVFEAKTLRRLGRNPAMLAVSNRVAKETNAMRVAADRHAIRALSSLKYRRFMRTVDSWLAGGEWCEGLDPGAYSMLNEPLMEAARLWLQRSAGQARKTGKGVRRLKAKKRHRLRIALKRLRYDTDSLSSLYAQKAVKPYVAALCTLQDVLGALNDIAVARQLISGIGRRYRVAIDKALKAGKLKGMKELPPAWRKFLGVAHFWQ